MPDPIRYHLDESVTTIVAVALRRRGVDVTTTTEAGLVSASDREQLAYAFTQGRVLVTRDADFLATAARGAPHAGLVYGPQSRRRMSDAINLLTLLSRTDAAESMVGRIEYL